MLITKKIFIEKNSKLNGGVRDITKEKLFYRSIQQIETSCPTVTLNIEENRIFISTNVSGMTDIYIDGVTDSKTNLREAFLTISEAIEKMNNITLEIVEAETGYKYYDYYLYKIIVN